MVLQKSAQAFSFLALFISIFFQSCLSQRGEVVNNFDVDPSIDLNSIFADQLRPEPQIPIPDVAPEVIEKCEAEYVIDKSRSKLACCLFGEGSGFCAPAMMRRERVKLRPLCNRDILKAPRSVQHAEWPIGQCCIFVKDDGTFQYECMEDLSIDTPDCEAKSDTCQVENVDCAYQTVYGEPIFTPVGNYFEAGVRLIYKECFARPRPRSVVGIVPTKCCGLSTTDTSYCKNLCLRKVRACKRSSPRECMRGEFP